MPKEGQEDEKGRKFADTLWIDFTTCEWTDTGGRHLTAVRVLWDDVEALLGRPHLGTPQDDAAIVAALIASDAPAWVKDGDGGTDEDGWYACGPEIEEED